MCVLLFSIACPSLLIGNYLLYVFHHRLAGLVKPGDYIFSTTNCARGVCAERVVQVSLSYKQGSQQRLQLNISSLLPTGTEQMKTALLRKTKFIK